MRYQKCILFCFNSPFKLQNQPLPAKTAVSLLQKEVCRKNSRNQAESGR